jgi:hypothetical protein
VCAFGTVTERGVCLATCTMRAQRGIEIALIVRYLGRMRNIASVLLSLTVTLFASTAHAEMSQPRIACCDNAEFASSCWVTPSPSDLTWCDPAAELALCELDLFGPIACEPVTLECCASSSLVVWMDTCKPHEPGMSCSGVVIGETIQ